MFRGRLSRTVDLCEELLNSVENEESRLKFDVDSLRNILTAKPVPSDEDDSTAGELSGIRYNAAPIVVETEKNTFIYENIDDLLERVVPEENLTKTSDHGSREAAVSTSSSLLEDVLRKGIDHKFIENKQLLNTYSRERRRHQNTAPDSDPARSFMSLLDNSNEEDLLTLAKHDVNLAEALPKYVRAVKTPNEKSRTLEGDPDFNFQRDAVQVALHEALLNDIAGMSLSSTNETELIQLASTLQAAMDFERLKKLICVKMNDSS